MGHEPLTAYRWAAIRETKGKRWIDCSTITEELERTRLITELTDKDVPVIAMANPVVAIVGVQICVRNIVEEMAATLAAEIKAEIKAEIDAKEKAEKEGQDGP